MLTLWKSPYVLLVLAACFWGGNFVVGKALVAEVPPLMLALFRWSTALVFLAPSLGWSAWRQRNLFMQHWKSVVLLTIFGVAGFNTLLYIAVQYTSSINASLMNAATPIFIVLLSFFSLRERLSWLRATGIIISLIGVVWIVSRGSWQAIVNFTFNQGDLWMLLAVVFWALYSIGVKKVNGILPANELLTVTVALTVILLLPLSIIESSVREYSTAFSWRVISGIIYVGTFASIVAFSCWNKAVSLIGPSRCAVFLNFIPLFSALFATVFAGEHIYLYHFIGAAFIIGGVFVNAKSNTAQLNHKLLTILNHSLRRRGD
jgi:drug/metabolite transporter (DMT)-like permease